MTPFEKAGYTKDTKFKLLRDVGHYLKKGDIVSLDTDDGCEAPWFKTEDGVRGCAWLPGMSLEWYGEELEVYEEPKQLTPFEEAGYTKDTKFSVLRDFGALKKGDIVTLYKDSGGKCPLFKTEDGRSVCLYLPGMTPERPPEDLEVYEEPTKELTPFEKAGYTKDTKFRLLVDHYDIKRGDIVTLYRDDGSSCPYFKTENGKGVCLFLPGVQPIGCNKWLEVYKENCDMVQSKKDLAKVQAFYYNKVSEGVEGTCNLIQYKSKYNKKWVDLIGESEWSDEVYYRIKPDNVNHKGGEYPEPISDVNFKGDAYTFFFDTVYNCMNWLKVEPIYKDYMKSLVVNGLVWDSKDKAIEAGKVFYNLNK